MKRKAKIAVVSAAVLLGLLAFASDADAQNKRRNTTSAKPVATPTPTRTNPEVISRADQFLDENGNVVTPVEPVPTAVETLGDVPSGSTVDDLDQRLRSLEGNRKNESDEKQRRLALNLEILTKAEQCVESLRKQYYDMIEKEGKIQERLDTIELDIRPDSIERNVAFSGSLKPEVLREARQKTLAAERTKLQTLLAEVQKNKANLDLNIQRADSLVERLRIKLEKEIDDAIADGEENR